MKLKIYPKVASEFYVEGEPHIVISIKGSGDRELPAVWCENDNRLDILFLDFEDIDKEIPGFTFKVITKDQAKAVVDFVIKYKDTVAVIICQCQAGISRSAGVADAIRTFFNDYLERDAEIVYGDTMLANRYVYRAVLNAFEENIK